MVNRKLFKKRKTNKIKNTIENNLKLVDLKIEDIKEHVPIEEKKEEKKDMNFQYLNYKKMIKKIKCYYYK